MAYNPVTDEFTDANDVVIKYLDESTVVAEDVVNENWRNSSGRIMPKRWVNLGNQEFCVVPPYIPASYTPTAGKNFYIRLHFVRKGIPLVNLTDTVDTSIPDYYQDAIRYAAVAYLMEKDTDLKSQQLKVEMMKSFMYHLEAGPAPLAAIEVDS